MKLKKYTLTLLPAIVCAILIVSSAAAQDKISLVIEASGLDNITEVKFLNINGDIRAEAWSGNNISVDGLKDVWRESGTASDSDREKIKLEQVIYDQTLYVYVDAPSVRVKYRDGKFHYNMNSGKKGRDENRDELRFSMDLDIRIPDHLRVSVSTVNGGKVVAEGFSRGLEASNVNGAVEVRDVQGDVRVKTVNGDLSTSYSGPSGDYAEFSTVNGSIEILAGNNFSADVTFNSLHGDLYTDFDNITFLPNRLNKTKDKGKASNRYRIEKTAPVRIGTGKTKMSLKTLNGSAYIKKRNS